MAQQKQLKASEVSNGVQTYQGTVINGVRHATALGFPTLNIPLADTELSGIYAGTVSAKGKTYNAALYADQERKVLEAHLLEFDDTEITEVTITPLQKIRDKETFDSEEKLKAAIESDIQKITQFFT